MRDRLIKLIAEVQYMGGLEEKLADHLINNGVLAVDFGVVSPRNRPLISQCFGRPLDEVLDLFRTKQEWISVEDKFPDVDKILGWDGTAMWFVDAKGICESLQNVISKNGITHWLPIPKPPKMKGGEE